MTYPEKPESIVSVQDDLAPARPADFTSVPNGASAAPLLMDIKLPIRVRMGRTQLSLRGITQLGNGSVVELDCSTNDPVEVVVNDRVIAEGEIVVVAGNYGVRITKIASVADLAAKDTPENELRKISERLK
jgi:flagellar motor switch protein FliN